MSITALDIQQQSFGTSRHGYDPEEVDVFLERVAEEIDNLNRFSAEANARIRSAEERAAQAEERAAQIEARLTQVEQKAQATTTSNGITEESISKAFIAAQRSADALMEEARREGEKVYREAESKARDIIRDTLAEKQGVIGEIDRLRGSCEKFRTEYLSLLNHFQADAQKLLPRMDELMPQGSDTTSAVSAQDQLFDNGSAVPRIPAEEKAVREYKAAVAVDDVPQYSQPTAQVVASSSVASVAATTVFPQTEAAEEMDFFDDDDELDIEEID
ncbi:MAG: DivIVA domain-containing protein [Coriobacteriaceae bacterium]|nr:DivIVA domain-containing protein [Coriobacteriaceae bacterium]